MNWKQIYKETGGMIAFIVKVPSSPTSFLDFISDL